MNRPIQVLALSLISFGLQPVPAFSSTFTVVQSTANTTVASLVEVLVGDTSFTGAKFNGFADGHLDLGDAIISSGTFTGGQSVAGAATGLILTADTNPNNLNAGDIGNVAKNLPVVNAPGSSLSGALFDLANSALTVSNAQSISTLEFSLQPTSQYLKLTYSLVISESGNGAFIFPDGAGIFVKSTTTPTWNKNQNCAVVPTTTSYVSMNTTGIVAPGATVALSRAAAQENYDDLVRPTLDPGYVATPRTVKVGGPAGAGEIVPPEVAYPSAGELGIGDEFITVPLTCVVDVSGLASIDIGIAVANFTDNVLAPALLLSANSIGFSSNLAPVPVASTPPAAVAPYAGPISTQPIIQAAGSPAVLRGERLDIVERVLIDGREIEFQRNSDGTLTLSLPKDLKAGTYDIQLFSSAGRLTLQSHLTVKQPPAIKSAFGKRISSNLVKMYYFNPTGPGTVSFRVDGREIAQHTIRPDGSRTGSKLLTRGSDVYMVRSVNLSKTRVRVLEIFVDGKRVWRASYKAG